MNQILETSSKNAKIKKYVIILTISIISILVLFCIIISDIINNNHQKELSKSIGNNYKIYKLFAEKNDNNILLKDDDFYGNIIIPKININYPFFYGFSDELLKISPCRFYGKIPLPKSHVIFDTDKNNDPNSSDGNLCILGHNYNDDRFFGKLKDINIKDKIIIEDLNNNLFYYTVFDKFEVSEDVAYSSAINRNYDYELTLVTCTNYTNKRLIIKAKKESS